MLARVTRSTLLLVAGLGGLVAGCGGGSNAPSVASIGMTSATTVAGTTTSVTASFAAFARCMTSHGVATSTGPDGHGIMITGGNPGSPQFQAAQAACQKLLPGGGPPQLSPVQQAQRARALAVLAACMRKHGVANFPDPNGQGEFDVESIDRLNAGSPLFQAAYKVCWSLFPKVGPQLRIAP